MVNEADCMRCESQFCRFDINFFETTDILDYPKFGLTM